MHAVCRVQRQLELGRQVVGTENIQVGIQHFAGLLVLGQFQAQLRLMAF